jgi:hypothetical protein
MAQLPTIEEMFSNARSCLTDAALWLKSDFRPVGAELTDAQAKAKLEVFRLIDQAKRAIDKVR